MKFEGRCWIFGDNVNTDLMYPNASFRASEEERRRLVFSANRPGWSSEVRQGDILIAGTNFGTGSARPGPKYFKDLGIAALLAESINGLFLRNCVNYALPAMECKGIATLAREGEVVAVDFGDAADARGVDIHGAARSETTASRDFSPDTTASFTDSPTAWLAMRA